MDTKPQKKIEGLNFGPSSKMSNLFYFCPEIGCNKKYKTKDRIAKHLKDEHSKEFDEEAVGPPKENTKANTMKATQEKQAIVKERKTNFLKETEKEFQERILKEQEVRLQKERELQEALMLKKLQDAEREREFQASLFEKKKLEAQKEEELNTQWLAMMDKIVKNTNDEDECLICSEQPQTTAVIPCGHKKFCYDCISNYQKNFGRRGCPCCRGEIVMIAKIY
jgi:hypothetical protein